MRLVSGEMIFGHHIVNVDRATIEKRCPFDATLEQAVTERRFWFDRHSSTVVIFAEFIRFVVPFVTFR